MAKAYTNIEQSRKLAKILPLDSADMWYGGIGNVIESHIGNYKLEMQCREDKDYSKTQPKIICPCWSLAILMELLPETVTVIDKEEEDYIDYILCIIKEDGQWTIYYEEETHSALAAEWLIDETSENLIDAAYNVIVKLNERKLL